MEKVPGSANNKTMINDASRTFFFSPVVYLVRLASVDVATDGCISAEIGRFLSQWKCRSTAEPAADCV